MQLEAHLAEVHRQSQRMIERQSKLGLSMSEFGASMVALGKFESGTLAQKFTKLGERADSLSGASQVRLFTTHASALNQVHSFKYTHSSALIQVHSFKSTHSSAGTGPCWSLFVSLCAVFVLCALLQLQVADSMMLSTLSAGLHLPAYVPTCFFMFGCRNNQSS